MHRSKVGRLLVLTVICLLEAVAQAQNCGDPNAHPVTSQVYPCVTTERFLAFPPPPEDASADLKVLTADIVSLDHRIHEQLGPDTPEWREVMGILVNAASIGVMANQGPQGRLLYKQAEDAFFRYFEARNRIRYLLGLGLGVVICTLFGTGLYLIARSLSRPFIKPGLLPLLCLFAGMGSLTSVLTRLDQINLKFATNWELVVVSGAARPVIAIFFALVVYLILDLKLLDIKFGTPTERNQDSIFLISSFLCGFSERFAQDILSKVSGGMGGG